MKAVSYGVLYAMIAWGVAAFFPFTKPLALSEPENVVLVADSTSTHTICLREKYGPVIEVDSVTLVIVKNDKLYITRAKRSFGVYPCENYSIQIKGETTNEKR